MRKHRTIFSLLIGAGLTACSASVSSRTTNQVAEGLRAQAACDDFSARFTADLQSLLLANESLPTSAEVHRRLAAELAGQPKADELANDLTHIYAELVDESRARLGAADSRDLLASITALEIGDRTTPEKSRLRDELDAAYAKARATANAAGLSCAPASKLHTESKTAVSRPRSRMDIALPVQGALRVLATAYQSCAVLRLPAMDADSIEIDGTALKYKGHNGRGRVFEVKNLALLNSTHYYQREGHESGRGCFDVSKKPMIYDFGGKPYTDPNGAGSLDLFRNNPQSPTQSLGIDCSGFIFSALATVGMKTRKAMAPADVYGTSAAMFMNPAASGLDCFAPVRTTAATSLLEGDILASHGHVVMVAHLGRDPWGLARTAGFGDCTSAKLTTAGFDFDVLQSSPVKGRIGIDRMRAADYLETSPAMKAALQTYAVAACKAQYGLSGIVSPATARLIRHKGTPECLGTEVPLEREACVQTCTNQLNSWNEL